MGRRDERRRERQAAVLEAAMALIEEFGVEGLTMQAIAKRIGASVGGLYRYYPAKEAILVALQLRALESFDDFVTHRLTRLGVDPVHGLGRLVAFCASYLTHAEAAPTTHRLLNAFISTLDPSLHDADARAVAERIDALLSRGVAALEDAVAADLLTPADPWPRMYTLWAAIHGLDHFRKRDRLLRPALQTPALLRATMRAHLVAWQAPLLRIDEALSYALGDPAPASA